MTYEQYEAKVKKLFKDGEGLLDTEVKNYFKESLTINTVREGYKAYSEGKDGYTPEAVASCLGMMY